MDGTVITALVLTPLTIRCIEIDRKQAIRKGLRQFHNALSEAIGYTVRVDGWNCDYSFGLNASYNPLHRDNGVSFFYEAPFSEYRELVLRGVFLEPKKLKDKRLEKGATPNPQ